MMYGIKYIKVRGAKHYRTTHPDFLKAFAEKVANMNRVSGECCVVFYVYGIRAEAWYVEYE